MDSLDQQVNDAADYFKTIDAAYQQALGQGDPFLIKQAIHAWETAYADYNQLKKKQFQRNKRRSKIAEDHMRGKTPRLRSPEITVRAKS